MFTPSKAHEVRKLIEKVRDMKADRHYGGDAHEARAIAAAILKFIADCDESRGKTDGRAAWVIKNCSLPMPPVYGPNGIATAGLLGCISHNLDRLIEEVKHSPELFSEAEPVIEQARAYLQLHERN